MKDNLVEELRKIAKLSKKYNIVSFDTEFPGVVYKPEVLQEMSSKNQYDTLRSNVNALKLIQLGLTLSDEQGNYPEGICTWQFNFKYDLDFDTGLDDSIALLKSSGLNFDKVKLEGIDPLEFGHYFVGTGLVLNPRVKWIGFHCG